eukprot:GHUV01044579.1.p2 GENE.GHUV01044579.1~~GHUV01044579.1.p2  ORF type:complete len:121 (-),score=27.73 GHUV01044579.1:1163-1525(-)
MEPAETASPVRGWRRMGRLWGCQTSTAVSAAIAAAPFADTAIATAVKPFSSSKNISRQASRRATKGYSCRLGVRVLVSTAVVHLEQACYQTLLQKAVQLSGQVRLEHHSSAVLASALDGA